MQMIIKDERLLNFPRYVLLREGEALLNIPIEQKKCAVFLGYRKPSGEERFGGTGFFVWVNYPNKKRNAHYLVTTKHGLDWLRRRGYGEILVRLNFNDGMARTIDVPLGSCLLHPSDESIDVAILPFDIDDSMDHRGIPFINFTDCKSLSIGPGDGVYLTGLFHHHIGEKRNLPVIRTGIIAAVPEEKIKTAYGEAEGILLEIMSTGGLSGAPVFCKPPAAEIDGTDLGGLVNFRASRRGTGQGLIGMVHGHYQKHIPEWDVVLEDAEFEDRINWGIGVVVPSGVIKELIEYHDRIAEETEASNQR